MEDVIRLFVGTEPNMKRAEVALEHSIRVSNTHPVEITWMDYSRGGVWGGWDMGRPPGNPATPQGWFTDFSNFRMAVPEAAGFHGRAIYIDVDFLILKDLWPLWTMPVTHPAHCPQFKNGTADSALTLFDCKAFREFPWWPRIEGMKTNKLKLKAYTDLLNEHNCFGTMDPSWYSLDGAGMTPDTILLHFTEMRTQPWEPYADRHKYPPHPRPEAALLWWRTYAEALEAKGGAQIGIAGA